MVVYKKMEFKTIILISILVVMAFFAIYIYFYSNKKKDENFNIDDLFDRKEFEDKIKNFDNAIISEKSAPLHIKSLGNDLACKALGDITGNKIIPNYEFRYEKGIFMVDCMDQQSRIAVDYRDEHNYNYNGGDQNNHSVMDLYGRAYINGQKENFLNQIGVTYVPVPYIVDKCFHSGGGEYECEKEISKGIRSNRMDDFLRKAIALA